VKRINKADFIKTSIIGGVVIVLPIAIFAMGVRWLFNTVTNLIQPFTNLVVNKLGFPELIGDIFVLLAMLLACFVIGWLVSTKGGSWFHQRFDSKFAKLAPGYQLLKDIVGQFFGDPSQSPFANGEVATVQLFGPSNPVKVTAIVTSRHDNGDFTVFMPTGPNPTSGNIYHAPAELVTILPDVKLEDAMRTIIACGAGTGELLSKGKG